jgi:ribosome recycling factor
MRKEKVEDGKETVRKGRREKNKGVKGNESKNYTEDGEAEKD